MVNRWLKRLFAIVGVVAFLVIALVAYVLYSSITYGGPDRLNIVPEDDAREFIPLDRDDVVRRAPVLAQAFYAARADGSWSTTREGTIDAICEYLLEFYELCGGYFRFDGTTFLVWSPEP